MAQCQSLMNSQIHILTTFEWGHSFPQNRVQFLIGMLQAFIWAINHVFTLCVVNWCIGWIFVIYELVHTVLFCYKPLIVKKLHITYRGGCWLKWKPQSPGWRIWPYFAERNTLAKKFENIWCTHCIYLIVYHIFDRFQYAQEPSDLYWENMKNVSSWGLNIKSIAINAMIILFAIFVTTPEVLQLDVVIKSLRLPTKIPRNLPPWLSETVKTLIDFLPTLLIWSFTTFVPVMVSWSDRFLGKLFVPPLYK